MTALIIIVAVVGAAAIITFVGSRLIERFAKEAERKIQDGKQ